MDRARKSPENRFSDIVYELCGGVTGKKWPYIYESGMDHDRDMQECSSLLKQLYFRLVFLPNREKLYTCFVLKLLPSILRLKLLSNPYVFRRLNLFYNPLRGIIVHEALPWPQEKQEEIFNKIHSAMKKSMLSGSINRRCAAANVLINDFRDADAEEAILTLLKEGNPFIKKQVIESLYVLGIKNPDINEAIGKLLIEALNDANADVRYQAAYALSLSATAKDFTVNISDAIEALMQYRDGRDPVFQAYVAFAVFELGDIVFGKKLSEIILDRKHQCRRGLFRKLWDYSDSQLEAHPEILEAYEKVACNGNDALQRNASELLYYNFGPKYKQVYHAATNSRQKRVRSIASRMLMKAGDI